MTPRTGRPRLPEGERLHDRKRVTVRLQPATHEKLFALAERLGLAAYEVVERAIVELWKREAGGRRR